MREFLCQDCTTHVFSYGHDVEENELCSECLWLRSIRNPKEREWLRRYLRHEPRGAYPERP